MISLIELMSIVSLVIAPTLAQINAKKSEVPVVPEAPKPMGKESRIKSEPVAAINKVNTVQYQ